MIKSVKYKNPLGIKRW